MLAGNEWLIVLVVVGSIGALVWLMLSVGSSSPAGVSAAQVHGNADDVLRDLQLATAGAKNTVTRRDTPDSLTAVWTHTPGWAIVVAVLLFPIGLIALVSRTSEVGTVFVNQESDGIARMQIAGVFNSTTSAAINAVIKSRS
ncbi:hypothetical protein IMCC26207_109652 [Actinobacteria bacterium IMCC26207]|nr:hypothetical protein IMCC26207_109652 [Actinobacteria bacterium IMCC26207]